MGEAQPQDPQVTRIAENSASRDTGGFWRTLPGILTAAGSFLAGLAGLAAVIVPNFFAASSRREATEQVATPPTAAPARVMNSSPPETTAPQIKSPAEASAQTTTLPHDAPAQGANSVPAESNQPASDRYIASYASDGFVVLRSQPTIASAEITRILVGVAVRCGEAKWVANGYRWRRCVDQDGQVGYMSDTFLRKIG